jgi:hypothetical protein
VVIFLKTLLMSVILRLVLFSHTMCRGLSNFDLHLAYVDFFIVLLCSDDSNLLVFYFTVFLLGHVVAHLVGALCYRP